MRVFSTLAMFVTVSTMVLSSCASASTRLSPVRPAGETRLEDISKELDKNPAKAIHLLGVYRERYGGAGGVEAETRTKGLRSSAVQAIEDRFQAAVAESRWADAASLKRTLRALGLGTTEPSEGELALNQSKTLLARGFVVPAFIAASRALASGSFGPDNALVFLERAVKERQRRSAAYFLRIVDAAGLAVPESDRLYATGQDAPSDMIKGVVTVWVDRGLRIEKGVGIPDRVIGSAFFVDTQGHLVTNYHVIQSEVDPEYEGYSRLFIRMGDSTSPRIPARVIGWDPIMDLALIKAEITPDFVFSVLDEANLRPGEKILAIGSPAGLESTVTAGIVSATGRRFLQLGDVVQIDAAVNHGNSGGPVVDSEGRLAGVVFAGIEQFEGLNFAVPVSRLAAVLPDLYSGGLVERSWLGLTLHESGDGVEIVYVAPGTPAAESLITEETRIRTIDGKKAVSVTELQDMLLVRRPGELVELSLSDGKTYVLICAPRPHSPLLEASKKDTRERLAVPLYGLMLAPSGGGPFSPQFIVKRVLRGSIADEAGLSENDPVTVNGFRVDKDGGWAMLDIFVKKRRMGYLESVMRLPAYLDISDTL